jgi:hypothetical protein
MGYSKVKKFFYVFSKRASCGRENGKSVEIHSRGPGVIESVKIASNPAAGKIVYAARK